jgi:hypothetical protein
MNSELKDTALHNAAYDIYCLKQRAKRQEWYIIGLLVLIILLMLIIFHPIKAIAGAPYDKMMSCYHVYSDDKNDVLIYIKSYDVEKDIEVCIDRCTTFTIPRNFIKDFTMFEDLKDNLSDHEGKVYDICFEFFYNVDYAVYQIYKGQAVEVQRNLRSEDFF